MMWYDAMWSGYFIIVFYLKFDTSGEINILFDNICYIETFIFPNYIFWLLGDFNAKYFSYFRTIIEKLDIPLIKWETIHYGNSLYRIFQWILVFEATGISRLSLFPNLKINIPLNHIQKLFLEVNWRLLFML